MTSSSTWVLLNESAHHNRARMRWAKIEPALSRIGPTKIVVLDAAGCWRQSLAAAIKDGQRHFMAAGGDGTVGSLFDALYHERGIVPWNDMTVGAVGLGSSNDFHKPRVNHFAGIPVRVDRALTARRDLGLISYIDEHNGAKERCFAVSASVGVVAGANALFNAAQGLIGLLKPRSPALAIAAAAVRAVASANNQWVNLSTSDWSRRALITNLSIAKTCHLAGALSYDPIVAPADGLLAVNLCENMSRWELLSTLVALGRGQFQGRPKTLSFSTNTVSFEAEHPLDLEVDGEVLVTKKASFRVLPEKPRVCL